MQLVCKDSEGKVQIQSPWLRPLEEEVGLGNKYSEYAPAWGELWRSEFGWLNPGSKRLKVGRTRFLKQTLKRVVVKITAPFWVP